MPPFLPPERPVPPLQTEDNIHFYHPGYLDKPARLLSLPRVDISGEGRMGVHFLTAHTACALIASNAFDGFLALDAQGTQRVDDIAADAILFEAEYFFFAGPTAEFKDYPVVPSFRDWEFPHNRIPEIWHQAKDTISTANAASNDLCTLTSYSTAVEDAHLVPRVEVEWFARNDMCRYMRELYNTIHERENILRLRRDIHDVFDQRKLVIVPKRAPLSRGNVLSERDAATNSMQFVAHLIGATDDYYDTLHNTVPQYLHRRSMEFLFARFAWAVIFFSKNFILSGVARQVRIYSAESSQYEEKQMTSQQLIERYGGSSSQNATPLKKRKREDGGSGAQEGRDWPDDSEANNDSSDSSDDGDSVWDRIASGDKRSRRAQHSDETALESEQKIDPAAEKELREAVRPIVTEVEAQYE